MNNFHNFNPRKYEKHLSPFGQKVLNVLISQWKGHDRDRSIPPQRRHNPARNRIITFRDSSGPHSTEVSNPIILQNDNNFDNYESSVYTKTNLSTRPPVPTSVELVKIVEDNKISDSSTLIRDELINPVIAGNYKPRNYMHELYYNTSDDENKENLNVNITKDDSNLHESYFNWDDMFDTELLPEVNSCNTKILANIDQGIAYEKTFHFQLPKQKAPDSKAKTVAYKDKKEEAKPKVKKSVKRKNQSKITDAIPKKVKKSEIELNKTLLTNNFRKQKYTKVVKNWLTDVDPSNPVEDEVEDNMTNVDNQSKPQTESHLEMKKKKNIEESRETAPLLHKKTNKKVIQAELANKDGVMKFGKPKRSKSVTKTETQGIVEPVATELKVANKNNVKDKPTKPKFIAPIKSQMLVKDVAYDVQVIDGNNTEQFEELRNTTNKEILMILLFSNGFSQLNINPHTDDTCIAEGVFLNIEDKFYYMKGSHNVIGNILINLMKHNTLVCYEGKNLLIHLKSKFNTEFNFSFNIVDIKIGGSLIDPDNPPENFSELQKLVGFTPQYTIATECTLQKTAWYATLLKDCAVKLKSLLLETSLWNVFVDIEMRLVPIIAEMEHRGICVDWEKLKSMEGILLTKMKEVEQECYKAAGKVFQINSTLQVRTILYDELQLDTKCNVKIKETISKGAKSTSETMLRNLVSVHALPNLILEYRHLHKAHATFLTGIAQHVKDGVVKPTWVQTAAATGRIASNNPNLQAIPKAPFSLMMFPEAESNDNQQLYFRSIYVSRPGYTFLAADFKHVECRVFAHAAADSGLLDALQSQDLFRVLAAKWLGKDESSVSAEDRERTKRIVYASLYGAGRRKLMDMLGVSYDQALSIAASFNRTFPSLKSFGRSVVSRCSQSGGRLATLCGRVRRFKNIDSTDFALKSHAERQAVNFIVQGTAADLCKIAMIDTTEQLRSCDPPVDGHLVLQIHDELVWEIREDHLERAAALVEERMRASGRAGGLRALPVRLARGAAWAHMPPLATHDPCNVQHHLH